MSPIVKSPDCTPLLCHCKVACTNNTLSLMFGCKVSCALNAVIHVLPEKSVCQMWSSGGLVTSALRVFDWDWLHRCWCSDSNSFCMITLDFPQASLWKLCVDVYWSFMKVLREKQSSVFSHLSNENVKGTSLPSFYCHSCSHWCQTFISSCADIVFLWGI